MKVKDVPTPMRERLIVGERLLVAVARLRAADRGAGRAMKQRGYNRTMIALLIALLMHIKR
ncbi:hypothetical protein [Paraburkholderia phytofirmans]|uniref:Transposase n=1 Tax=Paraburkholderia phytofirmans TaxID=261302 RepID=A0ABW9B9R9_9BURK|nr:hypothetical protein [Paraburkholderia phytofirmans]